MDHTPQLPLFTTSSHDSAQEIPYGYCHCGCGQRTNIAKASNPRYGIIKGQPSKYVHGHSRKAPATIDAAFWARCPKGKPNDCWEWQGRREDDGYGILGYRFKKYIAHRVSYELHYGPIPPGLAILHHCDNPSCCNPAHLSTGTNGDNVADMVSKGRQAKGENASGAKLTESAVREILRLGKQGVSRKDLQTRFGVSKNCIKSILTGLTWKHLK